MKSPPEIRSILANAVHLYDSFSLLWRKPRLEGKPGWEIQLALEPFKLREELTDNWPGTQIFYGKELLAYYRICSETLDLLSKVSDIFSLFGDGTPEDLTFYKDGVAAFVTISHEEVAYEPDS